MTAGEYTMDGNQHGLCNHTGQLLELPVKSMDEENWCVTSRRIYVGKKGNFRNKVNNITIYNFDGYLDKFFRLLNKVRSVSCAYVF